MKATIGVGRFLPQRTTRSGRLTEDGEQLYASVAPAFEQLRSSVAALGELSHEPRGKLRLLVPAGAELFLRDNMIAGRRTDT